MSIRAPQHVAFKSTEHHSLRLTVNSAVIVLGEFNCSVHSSCADILHLPHSTKKAVTVLSPFPAMIGLLRFCLHLPPDGRQISENTFPDPPPGQWQHSVDQAHQTEWDKGRYWLQRLFLFFTIHRFRLKVKSLFPSWPTERRWSYAVVVMSSAAEALRLMLAVSRSKKITDPSLSVYKEGNKGCLSFTQS